LRDRSGAIDVLEDVVLVAVAMGGESTHQKAPIKTNVPNSSEAQPEVQGASSLLDGSGASLRLFLHHLNARSLRIFV
jgi:hypothetical protein